MKTVKWVSLIHTKNNAQNTDNGVSASNGKARGIAPYRGSIFTVLVLRVTVSVLTLIVSILVLVLPLLSWSCASRPRQFKTPVEKCQQPIDSPQTQLEKYLTVISREDFDPAEQPAVTLTQFHGLWPLFSRLWCVSSGGGWGVRGGAVAVSYTHLTLPTIYSV